MAGAAAPALKNKGNAHLNALPFVCFGSNFIYFGSNGLLSVFTSDLKSATTQLIKWVAPFAIGVEIAAAQRAQKRYHRINFRTR